MFVSRHKLTRLIVGLVLALLSRCFFRSQFFLRLPMCFRERDIEVCGYRNVHIVYNQDIHMYTCTCKHNYAYKVLLEAQTYTFSIPIWNIYTLSWTVRGIHKLRDVQRCVICHTATTAEHVTCTCSCLYQFVSKPSTQTQRRTEDGLPL